MKTNLSSVAAWLFLFLSTPIFINALLPQIFILLGRPVVSYGLPLIILLLFILLYYLLISKDILYRRYIFLSCFSLFAYTSIMIFKYSHNHDFRYIVSGYNSTLLFYIMIVASLTSPFIKEKLARNFLYTVCFLCCILGILQYLTNNPIVAVSDLSNNFKVASYVYINVFPNRVRGFSLFTSGLDFGYFLIFCLGVFMYKSKLRVTSISIITVIFLAVFSTLTRHIYIGITLSFIASLIYRRMHTPRAVLYFLPLLSFLFGIFINAQQTNGVGLVDNSSLQIRQQFWQQETKRQIEATSSTFFFGEGIYQSGDTKENKFFVDNTYLQFLAQYGLIGFILFFFVYLSLLNLTIKEKNSSINAGLYGFLVSWPFIGLFNICIYPIAIFGILAIAVRPSDIKEIRHG